MYANPTRRVPHALVLPLGQAPFLLLFFWFEGYKLASGITLHRYKLQLLTIGTIVHHHLAIHRLHLLIVHLHLAIVWLHLLIVHLHLVITHAHCLLVHWLHHSSLSIWSHGLLALALLRWSTRSVYHRHYLLFLYRHLLDLWFRIHFIHGNVVLLSIVQVPSISTCTLDHAAVLAAIDM